MGSFYPEYLHFGRNVKGEKCPFKKKKKIYDGKWEDASTIHLNSIPRDGLSIFNVKK